MKKNILFYIIAFGLLVLIFFYFSMAYQKLRSYSELTNRHNTVQNSFQKLSRLLLDKATILDLTKASNSSKAEKLFYTDSQLITQQLNFLQITVQDSISNEIVEKLDTEIRSDLPWILRNDMQDSIIYNKLPEHVVSLQSLDSLIDVGIQRTNFLLTDQTSKLNETINKVRIKMLLFIGLFGILLFYTTINHFRQLSKRKRSIFELKESEKRYSNLFHLSPQPMFVFDSETFRFAQVNKAAIELYGYSEEEFLNMSLMDIRGKEDIIKGKELIAIRNPDDRVFKSTFMHYKKSGEMMEVEFYSTSIIINGRNCRSAISIDVTEKNLYEHKITKAIIKAQEDERYEIGSELHDNVCQLLATSQINLGMLKESLPSSKMQFHNQCKEYIAMALDEIRNLSHRLAPAFFDDSTLEEAFEKLCNSFNVEKKYKVLLQFDETVKKHPASLEIQLNLYRILQEQLRNILKYSKATLIEIDVLIYNNRLKMKISDNGIGFNIDTVKSGIGLANMKRRAELFSGKFEIDSSPGNGCAIIIDIPLEKQIITKRKISFQMPSHG
jgi:PAS domain S-box-containing protein